VEARVAAGKTNNGGSSGLLYIGGLAHDMHHADSELRLSPI
jgi:hypothetical protein